MRKQQFQILVLAGSQEVRDEIMRIEEEEISGK
jgi:hypothetical protein